MTKFSTFLVFVFGLFLMIAIAVTFTQKNFFAPPPAPPEDKVELPEVNLPALELGTRDQFAQRLAKLALTGGVESVKVFVERELMPGRVLQAADSAGEPLTERRVVDREVRRCDAEGVAPLDKPPLVPRANLNLRAGGSVQIQTWTRTDVPQPFVVTLLWVKGGK